MSSKVNFNNSREEEEEEEEEEGQYGPKVCGENFTRFILFSFPRAILIITVERNCESLAQLHYKLIIPTLCILLSNYKTRNLCILLPSCSTYDANRANYSIKKERKVIVCEKCIEKGMNNKVRVKVTLQVYTRHPFIIYQAIRERKSI